MNKMLYFILIGCSFNFAQTDFSLEDINPNSQSFGQIISPSNFESQVSLYYFGHFNWVLCTSLFGQLSDFSQDLESNGIENVNCIGIGKDNFISSLSNWTNGNSIPIVADSSPFSVWSDWEAGQRDLFIVDTNGQIRYHENISSGFDNDYFYNLVMELLDEANNTLTGDINGDAMVNVLDVVTLVNIILGSISATDSADLNADGLYNVLDIVVLVNIILN